jgi:DNA-binding protein H-NS
MAHKVALVKRAKKAGAPVRQSAPRSAKAPSESETILASLDDLSVETLQRVVERAQALIEQKSDGVRKSFVEEVTTRAAGLGTSIAGLLSRAVPDRLLASGPVAEKTAGAKRASGTPKYRFPDGSVWTGRGRMPRQLAELEAEGHSRDDYLIDKGAEGSVR